MLGRTLCIKYIVNIEMHVIGCLYIMDQITARKMQNIKIHSLALLLSLTCGLR
jgi:tRNA G46 methylase TrmB